MGLVFEGVAGCRTRLVSDEVPPIVQAWIGQLLDPRILGLLRACADGQVDVRLSAARGRVRANPTITVNAGPAEMTEP
jgi:hypothetical protein